MAIFNIPRLHSTSSSSSLKAPTPIKEETRPTTPTLRLKTMSQTRPVTPPDHKPLSRQPSMSTTPSVVVVVDTPKSVINETEKPKAAATVVEAPKVMDSGTTIKVSENNTMPVVVSHPFVVEIKERPPPKDYTNFKAFEEPRIDQRLLSAFAAEELSMKEIAFLLDFRNANPNVSTSFGKRPIHVMKFYVM